MKIIFILLILLPTFIFSQEPAKGTKKIIVSGASFDKIVNLLLDSGFEIKEINKDYKTIQTKKHGDYDEEFYVRVKDSTATITGKWYGGSFEFEIEQHWNPVYIGHNWLTHSRPMVETWQDMDRFAKSLGGIVAYSAK